MQNLPPSFTNSMPFSPLTGRAGLLLWVREFLEKTNIEGFYIEYGVFNGESIKEAYYTLRNQVSKYIGLDSFSGLPAVDHEVDQSGSAMHKQFVKGNFCSQGYDFVRQNILSTGIHSDNILLVKGFFNESLNAELSAHLATIGNGKASIIHLDADLYSSTIQALEFSYSFMQTGCWLLCDDYWCYGGASSLGTHRALTDFLSAHPDILFQEYCSYSGWSKAFIIEKRI
jgi:hypothetical protein